MKNHKNKLFSRRAFARQAALFSASASLVSSGFASEQLSSSVETSQLPDNFPKLTPEEQAEADARCQLVLSRCGTRLKEDERAMVKMACYFVQPSLQRLRAFPLKNGDVPALFLRPLVEREKTAGAKQSEPASVEAKKKS
jgi:hypothetical protein